MTDFRRNVDPSFRRKTDKNVLELDKYKSDYNSCKLEVEKCSQRLEMEKSKLQQARSLSESMLNKLSDAQVEIDCDPLPEGAQPRSRIQTRDRIQLEVEQAEAALHAQKSATQKASEHFMEAERKLFEADRALNRFAENLEDTILAIATIEQMDKDKANRLKKLESDVAARKERERQQEKEAQEAQQRELAELKAKQEKTSKKLNTVARSKVAESTGKLRGLTHAMEEQNEALMQDRVEAVLELKTNVAAVNAKLATQAEKYRQKVASAKQRLEDEKEALLSKGLNPYVEFRRKELDTEAEQREKKLRDSIEKNKLDLAVRIEKEQRLEDKQIKAQRLAHEYERKHRESQGRHVLEEKNSSYIVKRTSDHMEVLDPTGRIARVDPSQITDIADYSFGLGKSARIPADSMKRITEQIRETLRVDREELGEYERLTNGLKKATSEAIVDNSDDESIGPAANNNGNKQFEQLETLANLGGIMPGTDKAALTVNLKGNEVEKQVLLKIAVEEDGKKSDSRPQLHSISSPKYKLNELSKFERDALDRAKDRHQDRIEHGVEQVAGGRVFQGQAFVSKPAELVFQDFEVGRQYRKHFTLTNVSYTFNSFKILDLEDAVIDFFLVTFQKPGRMSAGMSCSLEIAFTPQTNQDIFTNLRFLTETGPVDIPLNCLIKRCAPRVTTPLIDFGSMVIGQINKQPLRITNTQALSTTFSVFPLQDDNNSIVTLLDEEGGAIDGDAADVGPIQLKKQSSSGLGDLVIPGGEAEEVRAAGDGSNEPAINEAELNARVQRVMTEELRRKKRENPQPISCSVGESSIDGYGNTSVEITCAPLTVGVIEQKFCLVFDNVQDEMESVDAAGELITREQIVTVRTVGDEVPIYIPEEVMDLRCTLYDRIYRRKIVLQNRAKTAYRVVVKVAAKFSAFVEVSPTMFFVQAMASQSMNVKFTPTPDILSRLAHFSLPYENFENAALMCLPLEIQVVNQELPLFFVIRASVCPSTVRLSSSHMDFGRIFVGQQSTQTIAVQNVSMLPQKIAFVRLRKEFSVSPNDGFAVLLPGESMEFEVSFSPQSAIHYELDLTLLTSFNDSYAVKVRAEGVDSPLLLSKPVIQMRTTGPGERVVESTMVTNTTKHHQCFEVSLPDKVFSWVTVSPTVVNLAPGKSCRLEVEFCPPENAMELDPTQWHDNLVQAGDTTSVGSFSPFTEWTADSGWVFGKGMFGQIQWVKAGAGMEAEEGSSSPSAEVQESGERQEGDEAFTNTLRSDPARFQDLPAEEWGVVGRWNLPILLKPRKRAIPAGGAESALGTTLSSPARTTGFDSTATSPGKTSNTAVQAPLFLTIQTAVTPPQLLADVKVLDFGQISVGTRQLKTFKVYNKSRDPIKLRTLGLNACGPLTLLRPIREIQPGESQIAIVECLPMLPGLVVEVLELSAEDESVGGHRLRVTIKVQGLRPTIDLEGLAPPPSNWNSRSGLLDFGHVLAMDFVTRKFVIRNKSTFAVDARVVRVSGFGLPPSQQTELIERTASGLPVISFRPERVQIAQGGSEEIEVTFRPDRGRFHPFREDLDVMIGQTDEILRVGVLGRSWSRQLIVVPDSPLDEAFPGHKGAAEVEDLLLINSAPTARAVALETQNSLKLKFPESPEITLQFPDPFAPDADPSSYAVMDAPPAGKAPVKGVAATATPPGARQQTKRLLLCSAKVSDSRPGVGPGTFEVLLGPEAKASGLWSLSVDKGSIAPSDDVSLDIVCTQAKPRSLGGIFVGSWKSFAAEIVLKGGWFAQGEADENRVPIILKAFVCL